MNSSLFNQMARVTRSCALLLIAAVLAACSTAGSLAPEDMVAAPVSAIGHLGAGIGIPNYSINGQIGGNNFGWGGGASTSCCLLLPRQVIDPLFVAVKWSTYRSDVDEKRFHEATVPVNFDGPPGQAGGMYVHFLPGHRVEVWVTRWYPESPSYPGPKYPRGPAPRYIPLSNEAPAINPSSQ